VLRGSAADLEAFLASATGVRYSGPLGAPGATVPLTLEIDGAAGRAGLRLELAAPVQPGIVNAGGTMRLPEALVATPGAWLPLALPAHSITGTGVLSLTVVAPADVGLGLRWAADAQLKGGDAVAALTDGSGTALTLRGTAVELSRYLSSGALQVRAAQASALGFTLESTPAAGAAAVVSTGAVRVEYGAPGQAIAAPQALTLQVPQALTVDGSGLAPTTLRLPAPPVGAQPQAVLRLELTVDQGSLAAIDAGGLAAASSSVDGRSLSLEGTAAQLNAWLAAGRLTYTGPGDALALTLRQGKDLDAAAQQLGASVVLAPASPAVPALALPQTLGGVGHVAGGLRPGPAAGLRCRRWGHADDQAADAGGRRGGHGGSVQPGRRG